jgi:hypothetical protein
MTPDHTLGLDDIHRFGRRTGHADELDRIEMHDLSTAHTGGPEGWLASGVSVMPVEGRVPRTLEATTW